ncbi:MAG: YdbL family protein [Desulfococcaceae bacterium]
MKKRIAFCAFICFIMGILFHTPIFAQDIKERMKARVPEINALKAKGSVGENNKGFLEFRGPQEKVDMISAENADRAKVYEAIAAQQNTTPDLVGKRRALQIRSEVAGPGEWLQDDSGKWYRK